MPNPNYRKAYKKENKIVNNHKKEGWDIAQRSASSKSPIDVWAVRKEGKKIRLIQSKPESFSEKNKDKLMKEYDWLNGKFDVEFVVI